MNLNLKIVASIFFFSSYFANQNLQGATLSSPCWNIMASVTRDLNVDPSAVVLRNLRDPQSRDFDQIEWVRGNEPLGSLSFLKLKTEKVVTYRLVTYDLNPELAKPDNFSQLLNVFLKKVTFLDRLEVQVPGDLVESLDQTLWAKEFREMPYILKSGLKYSGISSKREITGAEGPEQRYFFLFNR